MKKRLDPAQWKVPKMKNLEDNFVEVNYSQSKSTTAGGVAESQTKEEEQYYKDAKMQNRPPFWRKEIETSNVILPHTSKENSHGAHWSRDLFLAPWGPGETWCGRTHGLSRTVPPRGRRGGRWGQRSWWVSPPPVSLVEWMLFWHLSGPRMGWIMQYEVGNEWRIKK